MLADGVDYCFMRAVYTRCRYAGIRAGYSARGRVPHECYTLRRAMPATRMMVAAVMMAYAMRYDVALSPSATAACRYAVRYVRVLFFAVMLLLRFSSRLRHDIFDMPDASQAAMPRDAALHMLLSHNVYADVAACAMASRFTPKDDAATPMSVTHFLSLRHSIRIALCC